MWNSYMSEHSPLDQLDGHLLVLLSIANQGGYLSWEQSLDHLSSAGKSLEGVCEGTLGQRAEGDCDPRVRFRCNKTPINFSPL